MVRQVEGGEGPLTNNSRVQSICVCVCVCERETVGFSNQNPGSVGSPFSFGGETNSIKTPSFSSKIRLQIFCQSALLVREKVERSLCPSIQPSSFTWFPSTQKDRAAEPCRKTE